MLGDASHWLLATFVIAPVQSEIDAKLQAMNASRAQIEQVRTCMADAAPLLAERAGNDWRWAATTTFQVAVGWKPPTAVLTDAVPGCNAALRAVGPLLEQGAS